MNIDPNPFQSSTFCISLCNRCDNSQLEATHWKVSILPRTPETTNRIVTLFDVVRNPMSNDLFCPGAFTEGQVRIFDGFPLSTITVQPCSICGVRCFAERVDGKWHPGPHHALREGEHESLLPAKGSSGKPAKDSSHPIG